jgi:glycosyltransferase involved in cell wall biosynthesis
MPKRIKMRTADRRVLLTSNTAWSVHNFRRGLLNALRSRGDNTAVLTRRDDYFESLRDCTDKLYEFQLDLKGLNPVADLSSLRTISSVIRLESPSILLAFTIKPVVYGGIAAAIAGVPFLPTITGAGTAFSAGRGLRIIAKNTLRLSLARSSCVAFQNADDAAMYVDEGIIQSRKVRLVPGSGVDTEYFKPRQKSIGTRVRFLFLGRIIGDKGIRELVAAASEVRSRRADVEVHVVGFADAENRTAFRSSELARWQSEGAVTFHPSTGDVRPLLADADCVVLPSYGEGLPRSLLEAAACGLPMIASNVPGCRDLVIEGITGLLCNPRDAASLANAFDRFLALSTEQRAQMGANARRLAVEKFSSQIVLGRYMDLIDESIGGNRF